MSSESNPSSQPGEPRKPIDPTGTSTPPPPPPGYVPAVYVQQPKAGGAGKIVTYLLMVGLLVSVTLNVYLYGPVKTIASALAGGLQEQPYNPTVEATGDTERVVVVNIAGLIDGPTAAYTRQAFERLKQDPPGAVVLRVESGGGYVTPSDQMWHAITEFKAAHPKVPVIASFGNLAASGGYYISAPCDYIFCERTTMTGSIGVMAQMPGAGGLIEKMGLEMNVIVASESPNKDHGNNPFVKWYDDQGELTQEGQDAMAVVMNMLDRSYATFFEVVKDGRTTANPSITEADMKAAATGAVFVGQEALDVKLVDEIGYLDDAIAFAAKRAKISGTPRVYTYFEPTEGLLGSLVTGPDGVDLTNVTGDQLRGLMDDATAVRLEYRMRLRP